jgi:hypothetical protein
MGAEMGGDRKDVIRATREESAAALDYAGNTALAERCRSLYERHTDRGLAMSQVSALYGTWMCDTCGGAMDPERDRDLWLSWLRLPEPHPHGWGLRMHHGSDCHRWFWLDEEERLPPGCQLMDFYIPSFLKHGNARLFELLVEQRMEPEHWANVASRLIGRGVFARTKRGESFSDVPGDDVWWPEPPDLDDLYRKMEDHPGGSVCRQRSPANVVGQPPPGPEVRRNGNTNWTFTFEELWGAGRDIIGGAQRDERGLPKLE